MVAMARALMGRPRLICMDEPTMGLSPLYVDRVLALIGEINRQGATVFMVEQNASLALQIAHRGYVLQSGRIELSDPRHWPCTAPICFSPYQNTCVGGCNAVI
jgi:branched-chain amino acid transport system ATP-binding protein